MPYYNYWGPKRDPNLESYPCARGSVPDLTNSSASSLGHVSSDRQRARSRYRHQTIFMHMLNETVYGSMVQHLATRPSGTTSCVSSSPLCHTLATTRRPLGCRRIEVSLEHIENLSDAPTPTPNTVPETRGFDLKDPGITADTSADGTF